MEISRIVKAAADTRNIISVSQGHVAPRELKDLNRIHSTEDLVGHAKYLLSNASSLAQSGQGDCALGMIREAQGMLVGARVCMLGQIKAININACIAA